MNAANTHPVSFLRSFFIFFFFWRRDENIDCIEMKFKNTLLTVFELTQCTESVRERSLTHDKANTNANDLIFNATVGDER